MSDPIGAALHADAEAARAEIRAAGITCPSCGVNAADLPERHRLAIVPGLADGYTECRDGQPASIMDFEALSMAANTAVIDDFRANSRDLALLPYFTEFAP